MAKSKLNFLLVVLIGVLLFTGYGTAHTQKAARKKVTVTKLAYQVDHSRAYIPQIIGLSDAGLQTKINDNLKAAILSRKNKILGSSIHSDFSVFFLNGNLLGIHLQGDSFTPGTAHPNKIDCGIHIDLSNGKVYQIDDLFKPGADFAKRIKELCTTNHSAYRLKIKDLWDGWTNETFLSSWEDSGRSFLLSADSLRVYAIPSFAQGAISGYKIPYSDLMDIINQEGELWKQLKSEDVQTGQCDNQDAITDVSRYFPSKAGLIWEYAGEGIEYAGFTRCVMYQRDNLVQIADYDGGTNLAMVVQVKPETVTKVFSQEEAYTDKSFLNEAANQADIILKAPLKKGQIWKNDNYSREVISTIEKITVPAGTFANVIKIKISPLDVSEDGQTFEYYAANVGLIMREYISNSNYKITSKLKRLSKAE